MSGPCLCGDPGCGRCFPATAAASRAYDRLLDEMSKNHAGCPHALDYPRAYVKKRFKKCWGLWWCVECLVNEFECRRKEKLNPSINVTRKWEEEY